MGARLGFLCVKGLACLAACLSWVAVQYVLSMNYEVRQRGTPASAECRGVSQACFCLVALVAQLMLMSQSLFFLFGQARTRMHRPTLLFPPTKPGILLAPPSQTTVGAARRHVYMAIETWRLILTIAGSRGDGARPHCRPACVISASMTTRIAYNCRGVTLSSRSFCASCGHCLFNSAF